LLVECPTCRVRLRLQKQVAPGTLLACPKCKGMISIPEEESVLPSRERSSSAVWDSLRHESYDVVDELLNPPKPGVAGNASSTSSSVSRDRTASQIPERLSSKKSSRIAPVQTAPSPTVDEAMRLRHARRARIWRGATLVILALCGGGSIAFYLFAPAFFEKKLVAQAQSLRGERAPAEDAAASNLLEPSIPHHAARIPIPQIIPPDPSQEMVQTPMAASSDVPALPAPPKELAKGTWKRPAPDIVQRLGAWGLGDAFVGASGSLTHLHVEFKKVPRREFRPAARLAKRVEEIERGPEPLGNFLRFACQFTAAPITVRPEAMRASSITLQTPVQVKLKGVSMGEVLAKPLKELNLQYHVTDNDIIVEHVSSREKTDVSFEVDLAPLVSSGRELETLRNAIHLAAGVDRGRDPSARGDSPRFSVRASREAIDRVRSLHLRLQSLRGLALPPSDASPTSPFSHRCLDAEEMLTRPVFLAGGKQRPLAGLLLELERQSAGYFLVDWPSLRELGLAENTPIRTEGERMPLYAFLEQLLPPMELAYRIEGEATLQITTRARELERPDMELYWTGGTEGEATPVDFPADPIRWDQLSSRLAAEFNRANQPLPSQDAFQPLDIEGRCWVVMLPQSQHRLVARALYSHGEGPSTSPLTQISMRLRRSGF
jgi:hypothetical protein